jgi:hypothetical protein
MFSVSICKPFGHLKIYQQQVTHHMAKKHLIKINRSVGQSLTHPRPISQNFNRVKMCFIKIATLAL